MITEERLTKALQYLSTTDEPFAKAKALMIGYENQEKTVLAQVFLEHDGTVAERDALARISKEFSEWREKYKESVYDYEIMRNKRNTESLIIEVWRSLEASKRMGNV